MSSMRCTIVTATFNIVKSGRFAMLERCVESVAKLKTTHEHIIIDGASADGTVERLKELVGRHADLKYISEKDTGIYNALNKGVARASGEWIYIMGCDDYLCAPEQLDALFAEVDRRGDIEVVIAPVEKGHNDASINLKACLYSIPYCHQGVLMKRQLIGRLGGFDENYKLASDYALCLKAHLANARHWVSGRTFAHYSVGGASSNWTRLFAESARVAQNVFGLTEEETRVLAENRVLPYRVILSHLMHANAIIRRSARYSLVKRLCHSCLMACGRRK